MDPQIENFIGSKRIAVVGFSRSAKKFGNIAGKELIKRGYEGVCPAGYFSPQISLDHQIYFWRVVGQMDN